MWLEAWKPKLIDAVVKAGIDAKIAASIPTVPVGYEKSCPLPVLEDWLNYLWSVMVLRIQRNQSALLDAFLIQNGKLPKEFIQGSIDQFISNLT